MKLEHRNIVGMINARGGSKGIPRKNIRPLLGKPLIAWSIEVARQVRYIKRVLVSTEDEEIAAIARDYGAEIPFMRPAELARDTSLQFDTIRYNVERLEAEGDPIDIVVLLQPTSPLRTAGDVEGCLELMAAANADTVITIAELHRFHPMGIWRTADGTRLEPYQTTEPAGFNRQTMAPLYWRTGSVYVMRRDVIVDKGALYGDSVHGYIVNEPRSWFNIDSDFDWQLTEAWLRHVEHSDQPVRG
jgi:CMP-N,N'-diacetyllegionaminic acid synthase